MAMLKRIERKTRLVLYKVVNLGKSPSYFYATIQDLVNWSLDFADQLPRDYDVVVGIPRTGLIVATLIALKHCKPLSTPDNLNQNKIWLTRLLKLDAKPQKILLVDDSASSGTNLKKALALIPKHFKIIKACLLVDGYSKQFFDHYYKIVPYKRIYEWGLQVARRGKIVSDLDGVLCENPKAPNMTEEHCRNVKPKLIPTYTLEAIVTNRTPHLADATKEWLNKNGIKYSNIYFTETLINKIKIINRLKPDLVFESDYTQANKIWECTKTPTLCFDKNVMISRAVH